MAADEVRLGLSPDQALVLFDWLTRTSAAGQPAGFVDQAEQRLLWDIEATLETLLPAPMAVDYRERLAAARNRLRDTEE